MGGKVGPYELNSIIQGDCLEVMPQLPDGSVDMILGDWPYGITSCDWDKVIPLQPLWGQCERIIKPNGAIILTTAQPFTTLVIASSPYFGTSKQWFKYDWVWDKGVCSGFLNVDKMPLRRHETILVFSPSLSAYNPQMAIKPRENRRRAGTSHQGEPQNHKGNYRDGLVRGSSYRGEYQYPVSIIDIPGTAPALKAKEDHPTQKPVALFAYLIRTYSNPGDLILDSAAGSCTTAIAAIETGRNYICIEKLSKYVEIGRERVRERLSQPFLIPPAAELPPTQLELTQ